MHAKPSSHCWMLSVLLGLIGGLAIAGIGRASEPEISGKKASEWVAILETDPVPRKRQAAALALGAIGSKYKPGISALGRALRADKEASVRKRVLQALAEFPKNDLRGILPDLADTLRYDKEPQVREKAAELLGRLGENAKPALEPLIKGLKDDHAGTRAACARTIGMIGVDASSVLPQLVPLLKDPELGVRLDTVVAVGKLSADPGAVVGHLVAVLQADRSEQVRREAVKTIAALGEYANDALPTFAKLLASDPSAEVRLQIVQALEDLDDIQSAAMALRQVAMADPDRAVRNSAIRMLPKALSKDRGALVALLLDRLKQETEAEIRVAILQELAALKPATPAMIEAVESARKDLQLSVREEAVRTLAKWRQQP